MSKTEKKRGKKREREKKREKKRENHALPVWPVKSDTRWPRSMSQSAQVISPELVMIWRSLTKRQQER